MSSRGAAARLCGVLLGAFWATGSLSISALAQTAPASVSMTRPTGNAPAEQRPAGQEASQEASREDGEGREPGGSRRKVQIGGLLHTWYETAFSNTLGGNPPGTLDPPGRNYGGGRERLRFRRALIHASGEAARRIDFRLMLDLARFHHSMRNVPRDLWVGYWIRPDLHLEIGNQKTGMSEEGTRSASELLTVARSIMNEDLPVVAGRIGAIRDTGVVLRYRGRPLEGFVGLWHDLGNDRHGLRFEKLRFLNGALYYKGLRHLTLGLWGGTNTGTSAQNEIRDRAGGTFLWRTGPHFFESEIAYARDYAPQKRGISRKGSIARGAYFLYAHTLSRKWQLVARYDNWDPAQNGAGQQVVYLATGAALPVTNHKLREYTFGINYYLRSEKAMLQVNYVREDAEQNAGSFFGGQRNALLANFQIVF